MDLTLSPVAGWPRLDYVVQGDVLTLGGVSYDLSPVLEGAVLPAEAVPGGWLASSITRRSGILQLVAIQPVEPFGEGREVGHPLVAEGAINWTMLVTPSTQEAQALAEWRAQASVETHVFATACMMAEYLSEAQTEDWVRGAALPAFVHEAIAPLPTSRARTAARITIWRTARVHRGDQLVSLLQQNRGLTDAQVDALFQAA